MLRILCPRFISASRWAYNDSVKRFFLSDAYKCEEAWANRLKNPVFSKLDPVNLFHELSVCFQSKKRVNVVDIDLLLSGGPDDSFRNEIDEVLLEVRLVPECGILPERATHAAIRWYIQYAPKEDLLNTLSDRINYGLFPDHYLNNLLMDKYLGEKDAVSAVKIAVLQMLQEDFDNSIMRALALHSCYNYLEAPVIWESYKEPEPDPDEEVKKVRVRVLRNPYFDDHFDIVNTNHLVGKTLWLFGRSVDGAIGTSSQLVGLVLYEKYKKCSEFLEEVIRDKRKLHADAVEKAKEYAMNAPKQVVVEGAGEGGKGEGSDKAEAQAEVVDGWKTKCLELLKKIDKSNLEKEKLLSASIKFVEESVKKNESADIEHQCQVYKQWEKDREEDIQKEIKRAKLESVKAEIEKIKEDLAKQEERVFFFDKEEEIIEEAKRKDEEKAKVVFFKGKRKYREQSSEEYIPPTVHRK